jgi:hypothetical protein
MDMQSKSAQFYSAKSGLDTKNKKLKKKNFNVIYKLYKYGYENYSFIPIFVKKSQKNL